jgi:hypothetical protein
VYHHSPKAWTAKYDSHQDPLKAFWRSSGFCGDGAEAGGVAKEGSRQIILMMRTLGEIPTTIDIAH